jgi:uncharacterized protein (TIGR02444 family)
MANTEFPAHPFWDFALPIHEAKGVGEACIGLQDRHGVDVNCVLFCCWVAQSGRGRLGADGAVKMIEATRAWNRDVVQALRAVRRLMRPGVPPVDKGLSDSLRRRLLEVEIDCERAEIVTLGQAVQLEATGGASAEACAGDAVANLAAYFAALGVKPGAEDSTAAATLLGAVFPDLPAERIAALVRGLSG